MLDESLSSRERVVEGIFSVVYFMFNDLHLISYKLKFHLYVNGINHFALLK